MFRKRCKRSGWYELQVWDIQDFLRVMAPLKVFLQTVQDALQPPGCSRDTDCDSVSEEIQTTGKLLPREFDSYMWDN